MAHRASRGFIIKKLVHDTIDAAACIGILRCLKRRLSLLNERQFRSTYKNGQSHGYFVRVCNFAKKEKKKKKRKIDKGA